VGVFAHGVANCVDLLPALSPLVRIAFLRAHIDNLELVAPSVHVVFLVAHTVALDCPLARPLPLHDTSSHVGC
jgi:hypothetical protein